MFKFLTARNLIESESTDGSRRRKTMQRLAAFLALASALAFGFTTIAAPHSAQSVANLDGQWTVVNGRTGQLPLNIDGSTNSDRWSSGDVLSPDAMASTFASTSSVPLTPHW